MMGCSPGQSNPDDDDDDGPLRGGIYSMAIYVIIWFVTSQYVTVLRSLTPAFHQRGVASF